MAKRNPFVCPKCGVECSSEQGVKYHLARFCGRYGTLTKRQTEILQLVSDGLTHREIALELGISPQTVKNINSDMLHRIGAKSAPHAVKIALQMGLIK
jgi:DNA-binding NarL/FixJ family response regulator